MPYTQDAFAAINRAYASVGYNIHDDLDKQHEFLQQTILYDKYLSKGVKSEAVKILNEEYGQCKILFNVGTKRICEHCKEECLAILYCERCIANYLKANFSNWTSGNDDIDNLIQKCQIESITPNGIIEWIPYDNLRKITYLTKGGYSEIFIADWIGGQYYKWDSKKQQLKRFGTLKVVLKKLVNVKRANRSWFDEAKSHLTIANKWDLIVQCYGLTQNPSNGDYMLVMRKLDMDLRKYLQQNHDQLKWKERIKIIVDITEALLRIHNENTIHRDLHSGNILYLQYNNYWFIDDLGFCGPADKPLECIYGNLPYIAPEVLSGKEHTFASDIYSFAMLMWEISSGKPPFSNCEDEYNLIASIVSGMRPKIVPGTPSEYKELMEQCWDINPAKRPDVDTLWHEIREINKSYYQNERDVQQTNNSINHINNIQSDINSISSINSSENSHYINTNSKIYNFKDLLKPSNATKAYNDTQLDLSISNNFSISSDTKISCQGKKNTQIHKIPIEVRASGQGLASSSTNTPINDARVNLASVQERYKNIRPPSKYISNYKRKSSILHNDDLLSENKELKELKDQLSKLKRQNEEIIKHSVKMSREISHLREENKFLASVNWEFGRENDELKVRLERYQKYRLPTSLQSSQINDEDRSNSESKDDYNQSTKRRKINKKERKGKKFVHCTDDEKEESESSSNDVQII